MHIACATSYRPLGKKVNVGMSQLGLSVVGSYYMIDVPKSYKQGNVVLRQSPLSRDSLLFTLTDGQAYRSVLGDDYYKDPFSDKGSVEVRSYIRRSIYRLMLTFGQQELMYDNEEQNKKNIELSSHRVVFSNHKPVPEESRVQVGFLAGHYAPFGLYLAFDLFQSYASLGKFMSDTSIFQVRVPLMCSYPQVSFRLKSESSKVSRYVPPLIPIFSDMEWFPDDSFSIGDRNQLMIFLEPSSGFSNKEADKFRDFNRRLIQGIKKPSEYVDLLIDFYKLLMNINATFPGKPHFSELAFLTLIRSLQKYGSSYEISANYLWGSDRSYVARSKRMNIVWVVSDVSLLRNHQSSDDTELLFSYMAFPYSTGVTRMNVFSDDIFSTIGYYQTLARVVSMPNLTFSSCVRFANKIKSAAWSGLAVEENDDNKEV